MGRKELDEQIAALAMRLRAGDPNAADQIGRLLHTPLLISLRRRVAPERVEEVYQETWLRFFEHLLEGKEPDSHVAWFLGIARKVELEQFKPKGRLLELSTEMQALLESLEPSLERYAEAEQLHRKVADCMEKIHRRYARILEGQVRREDRHALCREINLKIERFHMFLHRARQQLKACVDDEPEITGLD
ncbi:MAG: hypothetical protein AAGA68_19805 [Pseudomonadota bacterium]